MDMGLTSRVLSGDRSGEAVVEARQDAAENDGFISIENVTKRYGSAVAVDDLSLEVRRGEMLVLLGPSGCGKTTTMRSLAGLEEPDEGRVSVAGRVLYDSARGINVPPNKRGVGMVFQSYAIWPHRTVSENVAYPLRRQSVERSELKQRVGEMLEIVGLSEQARKSASQLSGGQMQRVALARSLVMRPSMLLFDEPLSNLDARLRDKLRFELRALQQETGTTGIYVTHDQSEALALADRIAVMRAGRIVQFGDPVSLYTAPVDSFVAGFLGTSNLWRGRVTVDGGERVAVLETNDAIPLCSSTRADGEAVRVGIRAEHIDLASSAPAQAEGLVVIPGSVKVASFLGTHTSYMITGDSGIEVQVTTTGSGVPLPIGVRVWLTCKTDDVLVMAE